MHVHDHLPLEELQRLARAIPAKRLWRRYQAVTLAAQGLDATAIAVALQCSVRSVQSWVKQYNEHGPDALKEGRHTGRPPRISGPELIRFKERVEAGEKHHVRTAGRVTALRAMGKATFAQV